MGTKLTAITPEYSSFENDQVLTAAQLNEFLNYFDDQDRLSRICLSGVGIVCGFKLNFTSEQQLIISQGCGITTDGDLLKLQVSIPDSGGLTRIDIPEILYTHFTPFVDNKAIYKPFFYKETGGIEEQIALWELLPVDLVSTETPISEMPNLDDKVVLLYLETYHEDSDLCVGISCDNQGILQVQNLRVLLVDQENADYILSFDKVRDNNDILSTYFNLSEVVAPRVLINEQNTENFAELNDSYNGAIRQDGIVDDVKASIESMLLKLDMATEAVEISLLIDSLFSVSALPQNALYFQYRYDLFKDVIDSYLEMKELFLDGDCSCSPDIYSFPKHLLLGKLIPTADDLLYKRYRHSFYKSPILCCTDNAFDRFKSIVVRLTEQLRTYIKLAIPRTEIKITPSRYSSLLGKKAIPFYYDLQTTLFNNWSYEKTLRNQQKRNLSYHTQLLTPVSSIQTPLKYNLEPFDFLRIEGHQGSSYQQAMGTISQIKANNGLSFDLKALGITISPDETVNIEDYPCEFADLQVMLTTWRQSNSCVLSNASQYLSSYSVDTTWKNPKLPVYYENQGKVNIDLKALLNQKTESNSVYEKMDRAEGSVGRYIADAYKKFVGCSANDIINLTLSEMASVNFRKFSPFAYDLTILKPVQILSNALLLFDSIPVNILNLDRAKYNKLVINANNICVLARQTTGVINGDVAPVLPPASTPGSYMNSQSDMQKYTPLADQVQGKLEEHQGSFNKDYSYDFELNRIVEKAPAMIPNIMEDLLKSCCNIKQIEAIVDEIERRKKQILLNKKLSEFVKKHPGLEHLGGVQPGGTFVMAYLSTALGNIPANTIIADFSLPYSCNCTCEL